MTMATRPRAPSKLELAKSTGATLDRTIRVVSYVHGGGKIGVMTGILEAAVLVLQRVQREAEAPQAQLPRPRRLAAA